MINLFGGTGSSVLIIPTVNTIALLRTFAKTNIVAFVLGYYAIADGGGGQYTIDPLDITSADNGVTIIVGTDGGRWKLNYTNYVSIRQAGCRGDGTDDSIGFSTLVNLGIPTWVPAGNFKINVNVSCRFILKGEGSTLSKITPFNIAVAAICYKFYGEYWTYHSTVENIGFYGAGKVGIGFTFGQTVPGNYTANDEFVNNVKFYSCRFLNLEKGIQFPFGNIGTEFYSCGFTGNKYGVYSMNAKFGGAVMHAGNKYFYGGEFDSNECGIFVHNTQDGFGGIQFTDTIFEFNNINGYFYSTNTFIPPVFRGLWGEGSGSLIGGSTSLDQWTGTARTTAMFTNRFWIFDGSLSSYVFEGGGVFGDINLIATRSRVIGQSVRSEVDPGTNGGPLIVADVSSYITMEDPETDGGFPNNSRVKCTGAIEFRRLDALSSVRRWCNLFNKLHKVKESGGTGASNAFTTVADSGGLVITPTLQNDGVLYPVCSRFAVGGGTAGLFGNLPNTTLTPSVNQWLVVTCAIKWISGVAPSLYYGDLAANQAVGGLTVPEIGVWYTVGGFYQVFNSVVHTLSFAGNAGAGTFQLGDFQVKCFDTKQEAQAYLGSEAYTEQLGLISVVAAANIMVPLDHELVPITGNTNITSIAAAGNIGRTVRLLFSGTPTVTDGGNLKLNGNFVATADDVLTLVCDGTNFYEQARSAN